MYSMNMIFRMFICCLVVFLISVKASAKNDRPLLDELSCNILIDYLGEPSRHSLEFYRTDRNIEFVPFLEPFSINPPQKLTLSMPVISRAREKNLQNIPRLSDHFNQDELTQLNGELFRSTNISSCDFPAAFKSDMVSRDKVWDAYRQGAAWPRLQFGYADEIFITDHKENNPTDIITAYSIDAFSHLSYNTDKNKAVFYREWISGPGHHGNVATGKFVIMNNVNGVWENIGEIMVWNTFE